MDQSSELTPRKNNHGNGVLASLMALAAGFALGILIHRSQNAQLLKLAAGLEWLGVAWINALRMTILPLIASTLIYHFASSGGTRLAGKVSGLSVIVFILLLTVGSVYSSIASPAILSRLPISQLTASADSASSALAPDGKREGFSLKGLVNGLVPDNLIRAAANGEILPIILASILFGFALTRVPEQLRTSLLIFLRAIFETIGVIIKWILKAMPIAVFTFALAMAASFGWNAPGVIGYWVVVVCVLLIGYTLLLYPIARIFGGVTIGTFARAAAPAQVVAVSTRSSLASLPALLLGAERHLPYPPLVSNLVLPLAVSTFKVNRAVSAVCKLFLLGQVYGVEITLTSLVIFIVSISLISFSTPGVPSGAPMVSIPIFMAAGIPVEGLILLNSVDAIPDIFKTLLNVTGDLTALTIVGRLTGTQTDPVVVQMQEQPTEV